MPEFVLNLPQSSDSTPVSNNVAEGAPDHAVEAIDRLPEQFKGKTNIEKLLSAINVSVQDLENAAQQVLLQRTIDNAVGAQLDAIGVIVGEARAGLDDETYRRRVRARISVHRSKGTVDDLIRVTDLVVFDDDATIRVQQTPVATVIIHVEGAIVSDELADTTLFSFLTATAAAGVRVVLHSRSVDPDTVFRFDGAGPGLDEGFFSDTRG